MYVEHFFKMLHIWSPIINCNDSKVHKYIAYSCILDCSESYSRMCKPSCLISIRKFIPHSIYANHLCL